MPTKNWLIRTKSNHILGPVSKDKVIELYHNGSVRPEDEICSGNGFWFFLREKDQVELYLLGNKKQSFNPMSEGIDVLTAPAGRAAKAPDEDITLVGGISLDDLKDTTPAAPTKPRTNGSVQMKSSVTRAPAIVPDVPEAPPEEEPEAALVAAVARPVVDRERIPSVPSPTPISPGKGKKKALTPAGNKPIKPLPKRLISDRVVMMSAVVVLLVLAGMLYYRKRILQEFIQSAYSTLIPEAHAQTSEFKSKKKTFLTR